MPHRAVLLLLLFLCGACSTCNAFATVTSYSLKRQSIRSLFLSAQNTNNGGGSGSSSRTAKPNEQRKKDKKKNKKGTITLRDLVTELEKNPNAFLSKEEQAKQLALAKKRKRTRKRVENPQQEYVYAAQRRRQRQQPTGASINKNQGTEDDEDDEQEGNARHGAATNDDFSPLYQARQLGLNPAIQHCDEPIQAVEPDIVARVQLVEDKEDGSPNAAADYAYIVEKPAGWSILGSANKKKKNKKHNQETTAKQDAETMVEQRGPPSEEDDIDGRPGDRVRRVQALEDEEEFVEFRESDLLAVMTPQEIAELEADGGLDALLGPAGQKTKRQRTPVVAAASSATASFEPLTRPSVVAWLKELKASEGTPIRGGKYWMAVAGATSVDDTGLVVLCPRDKVDRLLVESCTYLAVVGNGQFLAPPAIKNLAMPPKDQVETEVVAKLKRGRLDDPVATVGVGVVDYPSTGNHAVQICQGLFGDGIRGDPLANPFDRRAPRRLVHCDAVSVSSLIVDDEAQAESAFVPDDIALLSDRRNHHGYDPSGSFLGRAELYENPYTNAYREINGAADGFPGWTVDRYDKWLLVQQQQRQNNNNGMTPQGPLPSIHDGNTVGVYYLSNDANRGAMGRDEKVRPVLMEGQAIPNDGNEQEQLLAVQENGVGYLVSLNRDLSTGMFLDQRPQRAWLTRHCNDQTRVLNCFAHCGAFSVAAASAGASTVSLDLNKKWLDRIQPQLELNGINPDPQRHDCIYGDCKCVYTCVCSPTHSCLMPHFFAAALFALIYRF